MAVDQLFGGSPDLTNMGDAARLRRGVVVDAKPGAVKVQFPDREGMVSHWLQIPSMLSTADAVQATPPIGTPMSVLTDDKGEAGVVLGAVYSDANPPPLTDLNQILFQLAAGVSLLIDRAGPKLTLQVGPSKIEMGPDGIRMTAPEIHLN